VLDLFSRRIVVAGAGRPRRITVVVAVVVAALALAAPWWSRAEPPATMPAEIVARATLSPWKTVFVGVESCEGTAREPRPLHVYAVRIDLREPSIRFFVTPSNGPTPKDCDARATSEFLGEFKCQVAINGSFFAPLAKKKGDPQDVVGLSLSRGDLYSRPDKWDALLIDRQRQVWIDESPVDPRGAYNGLSGHEALLIDGRLALDPDDRSDIVVKQHPRTAAGISKDRRYLILVVIDGRQPGYSEGTTLPETAAWMAKLGSYEALNLDGGGSSTLVIEGPDGKPNVVNRPSGGIERRVANHLGVFAKRRSPRSTSASPSRPKPSATATTASSR
jgi:hypothetical protein